MNVLMLSEVSADTVIGGAERMLRELASNLHRAGHHVRLVVREPAGDPRSQVVIDGVTEWRYPVSRRSDTTFVLSSLRESLKAFDAARVGISVDVVITLQSLAGLGPILLRKGAAPAWVYLCLSLAHEEYRSRVHAGRCQPGCLRRALAIWLRRRIERAVLRRCDRVSVMSDFMRRRVQRVHGIPDRRLHTLPGAADLTKFRPAQDRAELRNMLKLPVGKTVLFTVRNLVPRMGLENLVEAIAVLAGVRDDIELFIGGEGPLRPTLEASIRTHHLTGRAHLLGFVPEDQLAMYYQAADLVVMPTYALEGFGLVTVEALACGTPVVGTAVGATPEILARIDPVLVIEGSHGAALARGIRTVLARLEADPAERRRLSARCRAVVEESYSWARQTSTLEALLHEVRAGRSAATGG